MHACEALLLRDIWVRNKRDRGYSGEKFTGYSKLKSDKLTGYRKINCKCLHLDLQSGKSEVRFKK